MTLIPDRRFGTINTTGHPEKKAPVITSKVQTFDPFPKEPPVIDWHTVTEFEKQIAEFFGAPYAVAVDSCTHGLELCLRVTGATKIDVPAKTYLSVPMLANKLGIHLEWQHYCAWEEGYYITNNIADCAVMWRKGSYVAGKYMCISFQYQKHLSLGRGGMILCPDKESADMLRRMSYDGREPGIPWREQNIETMGYHYYLTPEIAALGLQKLPAAIAIAPRNWSHEDYPDLTQMEIFKR